ncbi:hypothetical protein B9Z55_013525 [Caenorhabditis nigoni]|uniref:Uncharacterized protein n=1 Tax=Caenorhabditis nigoni TaxID=1611254 RepID=A0A2G5U2Y9_9PELO|nr:hypothetical protein B9Z55_013525 [Caenorhabditis nigoni]
MQIRGDIQCYRTRVKESTSCCQNFVNLIFFCGLFLFCSPPRFVSSVTVSRSPLSVVRCPCISGLEFSVF